MFTLATSNSYIWTVTVELPDDKNKIKKQSFDAEFKRLPQSRINEILAAFKQGDGTDVSLASEILIGWSGINDSDGNEVIYSEQAKEKLLDIMGVSAAIVTALFDSFQGAKRKNL
jgi:hypothetical protein